MREIDLRAVGIRIKEIREKRNLTQEELADMIDMSTTHISVIERGLKVPKLDTFVIIANALHVSADTLLIDVVDKATDGVTSDLSELLAERPNNEQKKILNAVKALIED